jgi:hypothetical protein
VIPCTESERVSVARGAWVGGQGQGLDKVAFFGRDDTFRDGTAAFEVHIMPVMRYLTWLFIHHMRAQLSTYASAPMCADPAFMALL